jgi:hypothetical protein
MYDPTLIVEEISQNEKESRKYLVHPLVTALKGKNNKLKSLRSSGELSKMFFVLQKIRKTYGGF